MFADVIVDISLEKLDRTFQYIIPDDMLPDIYIGVSVQIPFGVSNRPIHGYVVSVTDKAEIAANKMKYISGIVKEHIPIESQLIELAAWIKKNYGSTMNKALKTVIPVRSKVKRTEKKQIRLLLDEHAAKDRLLEFESKKNMAARARMLKELMHTDLVSYERITGKLNISRPTIQYMEEQGIIEILSETVYRNPIRVSDVQAYRLQLNPEQQRIAEQISASFDAGKTHLIHGITGSGKTEIYMELISRMKDRGKETIVLIPEIALTYQTVMRFYSKFGNDVTIMNSRLSPGERYDQFEKAKNGKIHIIIGPRSALFTPFRNLGLIIIDEEHEGAYKSDSVPKYHARETAIKRAEMCGATVVLGSATPSLDSYYKAKNGEYILHKLGKRAGGGTLSRVYTVDLREELRSGNKTIFSSKLRELIIDRLERNEQIILFINRRGYAGFISCRACGKAIKCPHCDISLTFHKGGILRCHYCAYEMLMPSICPVCSSKYLARFGIGTQKVESAVTSEFPNARVLRMDMDTTKAKDGHEKILSAFAKHEADILVGTQMIVKGHDFPSVTLVGVIAADLSLYASDYKAAERTFQLLTQAAGRAGRGRMAGEVVIQTYSPDHNSVTAAAGQDYDDFYNQEIIYRTMMKYPPVYAMATILIESEKEDEAAHFAAFTADLVRKQHVDDLIIIGPAEAAISKINDIYRKVIYLKYKNYDILTHIKDKLEDKLEKYGKKISIQFDFNPMNNY